jgi:GNAT superfamily N-acetyltransferase
MRRGRSIPRGVVIRPAVPGDVLPLAASFHRAWQATYRGLLPDAILDALQLPEFERRRARSMHRARTRGSAVWVAVLDGRVVGFVEAGPCRDVDATEESGEIYSIYLDPAARGRGIGRPLMVRATAWLRRHGYHDARLWVLRGNHRALRFYRASGWRDDGARAGFRIASYPVVEQRLRRRLTPLGRG